MVKITSFSHRLKVYLNTAEDIYILFPGGTGIGGGGHKGITRHVKETEITVSFFFALGCGLCVFLVEIGALQALSRAIELSDKVLCR